MEVLGKCHAQLGSALVDALEGLKPAQMTSLEEHFRQNPKAQVGGRWRRLVGWASCRAAGTVLQVCREILNWCTRFMHCCSACFKVALADSVLPLLRTAAAGGAHPQDAQQEDGRRLCYCRGGGSRQRSGGCPWGSSRGLCHREDESEGGGGGLDPEDFLPRLDISGSITPELLSKLASNVWKDRDAAVDQVRMAELLAGYTHGCLACSDAMHLQPPML